MLSSLYKSSIDAISIDRKNNAIIHGSKIVDTDLFLFLIVPFSRMNHWDLVFMFITLIVLIFVILYWAIYIQTRSVVESVESMTERMNRISHGEINLKMKNNRNILEFNQMSDAFNEMLENMKILP